MQDEVDTSSAWMCPECGELIRTDYGQMQASILVHESTCKGKAKKAGIKSKRGKGKRVDR